MQIQFQSVFRADMREAKNTSPVFECRGTRREQNRNCHRRKAGLSQISSEGGCLTFYSLLSRMGSTR